MEIYKLSDSVDKIKTVSSETVRDNGSDEVSRGNAVSGFVITNLKQGIRNPNRVNVFINSKYAFSLDVSQVVDLKLKVGSEISEEELAEYKKASEFGKLYQRTLEWVLVRPRSEREVRDYITRKLRMSISETLGPARRYGRTGAQSLLVSRESSSIDISELSNDIISRFVSKGYIDDAKFAQYYVENRFVKKGISRKRLELELIKKGISREIIDEVLDMRNDEEEILKIIAKKRAKYDDEKLIAYLCRQGFSYQLVQSLVLDYGKD